MLAAAEEEPACVHESGTSLLSSGAALNATDRRLRDASTAGSTAASTAASMAASMAGSTAGSTAASMAASTAGCTATSTSASTTASSECLGSARLSTSGRGGPGRAHSCSFSTSPSSVIRRPSVGRRTRARRRSGPVGATSCVVAASSSTGIMRNRQAVRSLKW